MPLTSFVVTGTARRAAFRSRCPGYQRLSPALHGEREQMGKKKGRLPDGSGPQRDRTRPQLRGGARQLACCSMRAHEVRRPFGATRAAGTMLTAPGRGTSETLPEILRPWPLWPRPRPRRSENSLCQFTQAALSRPQSRQRPKAGRGRCRSGVEFQPPFPPPIAARRCEI